MADEFRQQILDRINDYLRLHPDKEKNLTTGRTAAGRERLSNDQLRSLAHGLGVDISVDEKNGDSNASFRVDNSNPDMSVIRPKKELGEPYNRVLDLLMPSGGKSWEKVKKTQDDMETEVWARLADQLNNKLYYDPSIVSVSSNGASLAKQGNIAQPPKMDSEDLRLQDLRREQESSRRTWNSGIMQRGKEYQQGMALMERFLAQINDVVVNGEKAHAIVDEPSQAVKSILMDLAGVNPDQRDLVRRILEKSFKEWLRELNQ